MTTGPAREDRSKPMKVYHDAVSDTAYIVLPGHGGSRGSVARTITIDKTSRNRRVYADVDDKGRLVGLEVDEASHVVSSDLLATAQPFAETNLLSYFRAAMDGAKQAGLEEGKSAQDDLLSDPGPAVFSVEFDHEAGLGYIYLARRGGEPRPAATQVSTDLSVADFGLVYDFDRDGYLVGIELGRRAMTEELMEVAVDPRFTSGQ